MFEEDGQLYHPNLKVILPIAEKNPVTCNNFAKMNSWYDIRRLKGDNIERLSLLKAGKKEKLLEMLLEDHNQKQLAQAADNLIKLIEEEVLKLDGDYSKIIIGGISQGCMVSLSSFFRF